MLLLKRGIKTNTFFDRSSKVRGDSNISHDLERIGKMGWGQERDMTIVLEKAS